jgi:7,8-dihydropterin-6-yl-methyl-4-(beta-D-ribofuranosyl)aminobenzene 5'-phosphate synthase
MKVRMSPLWWPVLAVSSPVTAPVLLVRNRRFREEKARAAAANQERIDRAAPLDLPPLDFLELDVLVEWKTEPGFTGDAGVSYLLHTDLGSVLFDVGFGPTRPALTHNAAQLGFDMDQVDALIISHLHLDHMGGLSAQRAREVHLPDDLMPSQSKPCFLPDTADVTGFEPRLVDGPQLMSAGIAAINAAGPQRVVLSGHDTDDYALTVMQQELEATTEVLKAGATYRF